MCWAQSLGLCYAFFSPKKVSSFFISHLYTTKI
ncbi:hypothetical protein A1S_3728 [Acinetobacter baumannii ATCC 17978]|nr:hypothetical protein A1S_3728 [Acinetobacter baumannii ATCC 17978]